ncbi:XK-related protein 4-like [Panonychus citri]|uniref:XK-related protein 4-like n=1 Tax=Panonychus citri TaxID=50023 RepID=UPI0023079BA0|nr:XK-related protein 4-like [Panonychus citri]
MTAEDADCLPSLLPSGDHKLSLTSDDDGGGCGYDKVDALPADMKFTWLDGLAILFSIGSFLFDIGTDIAVAVIHFTNKDYWYFGLTLSFILFPTLVMTGISLRWYVLDAREEGSPKVSTTQWTLRVIFLLFQLGPILRYIDSLIYGIKFLQHKSNKLEQKKYYHYMVYEDTDATMLRLFECFMEAAPQLVLQIYILAVLKSPYGDDHLMVLTQIAACIASLVSLSWSLVSYQRSLRLSLPNKVSLTWQGIGVQFLWRFFVIAARVLALALFASIYNWYISIVCGVHCIIMFAWIVSMKTSFCENRCEELGYNAVLAVMYIFCYFNPVDSPTRYRYTIYYIFMFCENTLLMVLWFTRAESHLWYRLPALVGHYMSFFTGLLFMAAYYLLFHPSEDIKLYRNRDLDQDETDRQQCARLGGYKRQSHNGLWTTQGRVLHPRPAVPTALSSSSHKDCRSAKSKESNNIKMRQQSTPTPPPSDKESSSMITTKGTCV